MCYKRKNDLDSKIERLENFLLSPLNQSLSKFDVELIMCQRNSMISYSTLLGARIQ